MDRVISSTEIVGNIVCFTIQKHKILCDRWLSVPERWSQTPVFVQRPFLWPLACTLVANPNKINTRKLYVPAYDVPYYHIRRSSSSRASSWELIQCSKFNFLSFESARYIFSSSSLVAHVDSLTSAIIPDQRCRANEIYDFSDKQQFIFSFRKYST